MAKLVDIFEGNGLFNEAGTEFIVYYDTVNKTFTVRERHDKSIPDTLIKTPYKEKFGSAVWKHFYKHLTDDERSLAEAFSERHGFFGYMHETGLYGAYEAAYHHVAECVLEDWLAENNITLNTINID